MDLGRTAGRSAARRLAACSAGKGRRCCSAAMRCCFLCVGAEIEPRGCHRGAGRALLCCCDRACSAVVIALRFGTQGPGFKFEPCLFHKA
jgi:hypothetical protein